MSHQTRGSRPVIIMGVGPMSALPPDAPYSTRLEAAVGAVLDDLKSVRVGVWVPLLLGLIMLFDSWDSIAIAYAMPSLAVEWHLNPVQTGLLISSGYAGQFIGAIALGAVAERIGRMPVFHVCVAVMSVLAFATAFAPDYSILIALRFFEAGDRRGVADLGDLCQRTGAYSHARPLFYDLSDHRDVGIYLRVLLQRLHHSPLGLALAVRHRGGPDPVAAACAAAAAGIAALACQGGTPGRRQSRFGQAGRWSGRCRRWRAGQQHARTPSAADGACSASLSWGGP